MLSILMGRLSKWKVGWLEAFSRIETVLLLSIAWFGSLGFLYKFDASALAFLRSLQNLRGVKYSIKVFVYNFKNSYYNRDYPLLNPLRDFFR